MVIDAATLAARLEPLAVAVPKQAVITRAHYAATADYSAALSAGEDIPWEWWVERFLTEAGLPVEGPVLEALDHGAGLWHQPLPGALDVLRRLRASGVRLAVVSNSDGTVAAELEQAGFGGLFEVVVDSHVVGVSKPDPATFSIALDQLGVTSSQAWHVGDSSYHDLDGAVAAGLARAVLVDPLHRRPGHPWRVGRVADLGALAERGLAVAPDLF